jgi:hypothetical protein
MGQLLTQCRRRRHGGMLLKQQEALSNPGRSKWAKPTRLAAGGRQVSRRCIWHAERYEERHLHGSAHDT